MERMTFWKKTIPVIATGLVNVFLMGLGMGVPVFSILFGFPVGWRLARHLGEGGLTRESSRAVAKWAVALAAVTFVVSALIWGPSVPAVLDPAFDAEGWGIPLILYTPQASAIGWLCLMIIISPVLQCMAVITAVFLTVSFSRKTDW